MADIYIRNTPYNKLVDQICNGFLMRENISGEVYTLSENDHAATQQIESIGGIQSVFLIKNDNSNVIQTASQSNPENYIVLFINDVGELSDRLMVRHSAIVVNPPVDFRMNRLLHEIFSEIGTNKASKSNYIIAQKSQSVSIPYDRILYFEARNKRILIRTDLQIFECNDTLDSIIENTTYDFMRIHRSFIVNITHVESVNYTDLSVKLDDGSVVYTSRSYKAELRKRMQERPK